jgi:hypothetical protein
MSGEMAYDALRYIKKLSIKFEGEAMRVGVSMPLGTLVTGIMDWWPYILGLCILGAVVQAMSAKTT